MNLNRRLLCKGRQLRVNSIERASLVLGFVLIINIEIVTAVTHPRDFLESRMESVESRYCDFSSSARIYNITELLQCMNELASTAVAHTRMGRSSEDRGFPLPASKRVQSYPSYSSTNYQYPQRTSADYPSYYERRPVKYYSGPSNYQGSQSGYYEGGFNNPYPNEQPFGFSGGAGSGLFDALASISQYDDLKCVPRILCEVATGVIPGNSGYKQGYDGGNSLISLLTALDIGDSSPLLTFGKSALTGYTSRGNPSVCYREYPKCPRNSAELINYLNNHNGGFFRFFGNVRGPSSQGNYYRGAPRREPGPPLREISGSEAVRTGTGELKFDNSAGTISREYSKSFFPERKEINDSDKVTFPQEPLQGEQSLNRVSKSLMGHQGLPNDYHSPSFFSQDRKDPESNMLYGSGPLNQNQGGQRSSGIKGTSKARLYLPDDPTNETISSFTFPDGQKVRINVAFSKLFSESYRKALRRSFTNDHSPQPVNFEGFSMVNLAELYPNDRSRIDLQVVHPCDMICHDSKGTAIQFNQILLHSGSLSTLMAPDQPILDLSNPVPCEAMCIDRRGERRQLSTNLNQVLRTSVDRQTSSDLPGFQDDWNHREYRSLNQLQQRSKQWQTRKVRENIEQLQNRGMQGQRFAPKIRDTVEIQNQANVNNGEKAASMPQGSILIGGGPMPFFGSPIPFMSMPEFAQASPAYLTPGSPGPMGMSIQPIQALPMPPAAGIIPALGMMPMFPGPIMPMMDPLIGGMVQMIPPSLSPPMLCSGSPCSTDSQFSQKVLMMCGGDLYFIPYQLFGSLPVCAIAVECDNSTGSGYNSGAEESDSQLSSTESTQVTTDMNGPGLSFTVQRFESVTTANKFRPPGGEDYPQQSCLEGQSWNLDAHECVPIKYDPEGEMEYIHLPGSPWSGVTRSPLRTHQVKKRKKLVIITDKGNITYIKAT